MSWFTLSNRWKHFLFAIPLALIFTLLAAIGAAGGMEFKDVLHGGKWDWLDFLSTILGGIVGQILQIILYYVIF